MQQVSSRTAFAALVLQPIRIRGPSRIGRIVARAGAGTAARTARSRSTAHGALPILARKWKVPVQTLFPCRSSAGRRTGSSRRLRNPAHLRRGRVRSERRTAATLLAGKWKLLRRALLPRGRRRAARHRLRRHGTRSRARIRRWSGLGRRRTLCATRNRSPRYPRTRNQCRPGMSLHRHSLPLQFRPSTLPKRLHGTILDEFRPARLI